MDAAISLGFAPARSPGRVLAAWTLGAWHLFRAAPLRILALSLLPIVVEAVVQLVPHAGIGASKLLTPFASAWVLMMLDRKARSGRFSPAAAGRAWAARLPQLLLLSLVMAGVFVAQLLVAAAIGGSAQAMALGSGDMAAIRLGHAELAAILASGAVIGLPLMFAGPRVVLDSVGVLDAITQSIRAVCRHWRPAALLTGALAVAIGALVSAPLLLLVVLPAGLCIGYASYRDVFDPVAPALA